MRYLLQAVLTQVCSIILAFFHPPPTYKPSACIVQLAVISEQEP